MCIRDRGGYAAATDTTGTFTTGFGHSAVLGVADTVVDAVKQGAISRFFLVGGCDGARPGRSYFRDFVQQAPDDSIILTLACGKFRFNDLDLGTIGGLPRIMDMGQCNDAYGAIRVAVALAEAFDCGVNDLPLTLVLSWYCLLYTSPSTPRLAGPPALASRAREFDSLLACRMLRSLRTTAGVPPRGARRGRGGLACRRRCSSGTRCGCSP